MTNVVYALVGAVSIGFRHFYNFPHETINLRRSNNLLHRPQAILIIYRWKLQQILNGADVNIKLFD